MGDIFEAILSARESHSKGELDGWEFNAIEHQAEAVVKERDALRKALQKISELEGEINPSNYNHDDVCVLNDSFIETYQITQQALEKG